MASYRDDQQKYFAALPSDKIAAAIWCRYEDGIKALKGSHRHDRNVRSWQMYFARDGKDRTAVQRGGRSGELTELHVNHYRNLTQHILSMVTGMPTTRRCEATSTDADSMRQAMLGDGIIEFYASDRKLDERLVECLERALLFTEAWIGAPWDPNSGEEDGTIEYEQDGEAKSRLSYTGDFVFPVLTPYEFVQEPNAEDPDDPEWVIARRRISKHRLAVLYPMHADAIMATECKDKAWAEIGMGGPIAEHDDKITVLEMYAKRSPELPTGRTVFTISQDVTLYDDVLTYKRIPYFRMAPSDVIFEDGGHSGNMDLLGVCRAIDAQITTLLSNNTAFGAQMLQITKGSGISKEDIGPLKILHVNPGFEVKPVQLAASAPESYTFHDKLVSTAEMFAGVGAAQRGNVEAMKGDSGAKQALISSQAQQFQGPIQKAKSRAEEALLTHIIDTVKTRVTDERVTTITGKYNLYSSKSYTGEDIGNVSRARVKTGDPMMGTSAGREERLRQLISLPKAAEFLEPQQIIAFAETGRFEALTEAPMSELMLIRRENEILQSDEESQSLGRPLQVAPTDNHRLHIAEHMVGTNDPIARVRDQAAMARINAHTLEHIAALTPGMPGFAGLHVLAATGQQPLPIGNEMGKQPGQKPPGGAPRGAAPPGPQGPQGAPPKPAGGGSVNPMPSLPSGPKNPMTGQEQRVSLPAPGNQAAG